MRRPPPSRARSRWKPSPRASIIPGACSSCPMGACSSPSGRAACASSPRTANFRAPILEGLPEVAAVGQGGLLDVLLAPDFAKSGIIYFSYGEPREGGKNGTSVARAKLVLDGDGGTAGGREGDLPAAARRRQRPPLRLAARVGARRHAVHHHRRAQHAAPAGAEPGQRHRQGHPHQSRRLDPRRQSRSFPAGRPRSGRSATATCKAPRCAPRPAQLYTVEHGAQGGDELNHPEKGKNYGWPIITYGIDYDGAKIGEGIRPRRAWSRRSTIGCRRSPPRGSRSTPATCSPIGRATRSSAALPARTSSGWCSTATTSSPHEELLDGRGQAHPRRAPGPDGALWVLTDDTGEVLARRPWRMSELG